MAPKAAYTHRKLKEVAQKSAVDARAQFSDLSPEHALTCEPVLKSGVEIRQATKVAFQWRFQGPGYDERSQVTARCDNVCESGVPLPETWKTALHHLTLLRLVEESVEHVRETEPRLSDLSCHIAGMPKIDISLKVKASKGGFVSTLTCLKYK